MVSPWLTVNYLFKEIGFSLVERSFYLCEGILQSRFQPIHYADTKLSQRKNHGFSFIVNIGQADALPLAGLFNSQTVSSS